mmetsp:Transcript_1734/g.190  ORF Transcript_1734/g.190 Transcript_1734/m.190 type:complete len:134 (+) Transcript_1734:1073-1474(+)
MVNFLLSLVEGDADDEILQRIAESLDFKKIKERMCEVFSLYLSKDLGLEIKKVKMTEITDKIKGRRFQGTIDEGFNLYILMHTLADNYPPARVYIEDSSFSKTEALAYKFFSNHTGRIEVVVNKMLTRTYFPI